MSILGLDDAAYVLRHWNLKGQDMTKWQCATSWQSVVLCSCLLVPAPERAPRRVKEGYWQHELPASGPVVCCEDYLPLLRKFC